MRQIKNNFLWLLYFAFVGIAIVSHQGEGILFSDGPFSAGKPIVWLIWLGFLLFSLNIHRKENFFNSLKKMWPILWSRQIGADLYIGLLIPMFVIFLHSGSLWVLALWLLPILLFANLATLIYLALNYQSLVNTFTAI